MEVLMTLHRDVYGSVTRTLHLHISWPLPSIFGNYCQNVSGLSEGLIRVMWPSKLGKSAVLHAIVQRVIIKKKLWKALGR